MSDWTAWNPAWGAGDYAIKTPAGVVQAVKVVPRPSQDGEGFDYMIPGAHTHWDVLGGDGGPAGLLWQPLELPV